MTSRKGGKTKKDTRKLISKNVFDTPFQICWPVLDTEERNSVMSALSQAFTMLAKKRKLQRAEHNEVTKKRRLESGKKAANLITTSTTTQPAEREPENQDTEKDKDDTTEGLVFGINAVTKALEKKQLSLVVVCKSVNPISIIQHLPVLCHRSGTVLSPIPEKSEGLGQLFGMKTLVAVGFKAGSWEKVVAEITANTPKFSIPWLENPEESLPLRYKVATVTKS